MKIGDVNTGVTYYFPITVKEKKEDKFSTCIVDTDGGEWDEFDVGQLVTRGEIIGGATDERLKKADDQIDFWKRDSESAHEEIRKLQEQVKILEDSNGQYAEQIRRYDIELKNAEENLNSKQMTIIQTTKRCADLQRQLVDCKSAKERDEAMLTDLNKKLNDRITELEADKARIFLKVKEVRLRRLHDMTVEDSLKDGVKPNPKAKNPLSTYMRIWDEEQKIKWKENPWVWVLTVERMEKRFKEGDEVYLKAVVHEVDPGNGYDYSILWKDSVDRAACMLTVGEGQLFSADESGIDWQDKYNEYNENAERKIRELANKLNDMAESLREAQAKAVSLNTSLKEVGTTNADLVIKNAVLAKEKSELEERLSSGKGDVEHWRQKYMNMKMSRNEYKRAADHLKEERDRAEDELALTKIMNMALAEKIERLQNG